MTFKELCAAVTEAIPGETFSVSVEYWNYAGEPISIDSAVTWKIWRPKVNQHFDGKSPEVALQRLKSGIIDVRQEIDAQLAQADPS